MYLSDYKHFHTLLLIAGWLKSAYLFLWRVDHLERVVGQNVDFIQLKLLYTYKFLLAMVRSLSQ